MTAPTTDEKQGDGKGQGEAKPPADDKDKAELRSMVAEMVESALKPFMDKLSASPAKEPSSADAGAAPDLAKMVDDAISKVLGDKEKQSADDEHRKQHEQIAAAAEKRPVERPKRAKWLGNIWDKDA